MAEERAREINRLEKNLQGANIKLSSAVKRGKNRAVVAVAHSMLIAIYNMLKYDLPFYDLGEDYYNRFNTEKKINHYLKKLQNLGWQPPIVATA